MNILKKILFINLLVLLSVFITTTKVYADRAEDQNKFFEGTLFQDDGSHYMNSDRIVKISRERSADNNILFTLNSIGAYCIQDGVSAKDGDYRVIHYIEIDGDKATHYGYKGGTIGTWKDSLNCKLTYVLNQSNLYRKSSHIYKDDNLSGKEQELMKNNDGFEIGVRNRAIWKVFPDWVEGASKQENLNFSNTWKHTDIKYPNHVLQIEANQFIANADYLLPQITSAPKTFSDVAGHTDIMGPFKISFTGLLNLDAYDASGNKITDVTFYSDRNGTNKIDKSDIKTGVDFYIKSNTLINKVKINVTGKKRIAKIWLLRADDDASTDWQDLMIAKCSSADYTTDSININFKYRTGDLTLVKEDFSSGAKLGGAKFKLYNNTYSKWLTGNGTSSSPYSIGSSGTEYTTQTSGDDQGKIIFDNIPVGNYSIYETTTPTNYIKNLQDNYDSTNDRINCGNVTVPATSPKTIKNRLYGTITITKKEAITNDALKAGFKIHVGQFKFIGLDSNGEWTYDSTFENAFIFKTGEADSKCKWITVSNGSITIKKLKLSQTYGIWEVEAPEGYELTKQSGYTTIKDDRNEIGQEYKYVYHGNTTLNSSNSSAKFEVTNLKYISVKGYVWKDVQAGKNSNSNSLYDTDETKIAGVTVRLRKKGNTSANVPSTTTDENGEYIFNNAIPENDIDSYYVEFDYSGLDSLKTTYLDAENNEHKYINYIPVELKPTEENGSKALMNIVAEKDIDLSGIALTYAGTDATTISKYGLSKVGTISNGVLTNVNLGIIKIPETEYKISQNLSYVKIDINGYTFTYDYSKLGDNSMPMAPTVNWQKPGSIKSYTADIYPSDIAYSIAQTDENKRIKVYVVYKIDIKNTNSNNIEELYMEKEKGLKITSLKNYYDGKRYTIEKNYGVNTNPDFGKWSDEANAKRNGKDVKVVEFNIDKYKDGIDYQDGNDTISSFIEFRVKDDAINKILENPQGIVEEYPTVAEAIGYHKYQRKDYSWNNNIALVQDHETPNDIRSSASPYIIFKENVERTIKGKVFEDGTVTNDGQKLGNGVYDNNENLVEGIKVDLIEIPGEITDLRQLSADAIKNLQPATRYQKIAGSIPQETKSSIITDREGNYNLIGVVPGRYLLRFTYGDGSQKIYDTNGNEVKATDGTVKTIIGKDYKSTIVKEDNAYNALNGGTKEEWYKDISKDIIASVALDNLNTRKMANEAVEGKYDVMASTAKMSITIENNDTETFDMPQNESNEPEQKTLADSNDTKETIYINYVNAVKAKNTFDGLSFGIIEVPKQRVEIQKLITNVTLTSNGNVLYNGNPENVPSHGVVALSDLDSKENGGSTYVRAEMQETSLYGTNIELTYEVEITNKSDIDYYINEYYWFGKTENVADKEVTLTPTDVKDYLDETLEYIAEKSDQARIEEVNKNATIQVDGKGVKAQELKLKGWKTLYTNKITNRDNKHQISDKVKIVAKRILSNNDNDMEIISRAEIKEVSRTPDSNDSDAEKTEQIKIAPKEVHTNGMVEALFTITPPTGENRSVTTIYAVAGIVSLILLSTGIVIIKKKVL